MAGRGTLEWPCRDQWNHGLVGPTRWQDDRLVTKDPMPDVDPVKRTIISILSTLALITVMVTVTLTMI